MVTVGPLQVELTDPFGLARLRLPAAGVSELVVYPPIETLPAVPLSAGNDPLAGSEHPNALGRGGEDFFALRAYVVGDDLRRVHWPATARHDELMVRQDELPWQGRTTVVIDDRAGVHTAESFERMVSAAASILVGRHPPPGPRPGRHRQRRRQRASAPAAPTSRACSRPWPASSPRAAPTWPGAGEVLGATGVSGAMVVLTGGRRARRAHPPRRPGRALGPGGACWRSRPGPRAGPPSPARSSAWAPTPRWWPAGPRRCAGTPAAGAPPPGGRGDRPPCRPPRAPSPDAGPPARPPAPAERPAARPHRYPGPAPAAHRDRPRRHDLRRGRRVRPHLRLVELPGPTARRRPRRPRHRSPPAAGGASGSRPRSSSPPSSGSSSSPGCSSSTRPSP